MKAGLYIHFPFCWAKCPYCHFMSVPYDGDLLAAWKEGLALELETVRKTAEAKDLVFDTIYIGGGTPSLLTPPEIEQLIGLCGSRLRLSPVEFSMEVNPDAVRPGTLAGFRAAGVTRLSVGVQSFDGAILRRLGRTYSSDEAFRFCEEVRRTGFESWSLDLMIGVPGESRQSTEESVAAALALAPDHVSMYMLENVEGLPFEKVLAATPADDDLTADNYALVRDLLGAGGVLQYEISNFSRPGAECLHNLKYWRYEPFLGLGPSASSHIGDRRWTNRSGIMAWLEALRTGVDPREELEMLSMEEQARETLIFGLRLREGVDPGDIKTRTGIDVEAMFSREMGELIDEGMLIRLGSRLVLPPEKYLISNSLFVRFV